MIEGGEHKPVRRRDFGKRHLLRRLPAEHDARLAEAGAHGNRAWRQQFDALNAGNESRPIGNVDGRGERDLGRRLDQTLYGNLHGSSPGNVNVFADAPGSIKLATGGLPERM